MALQRVFQSLGCLHNGFPWFSFMGAVGSIHAVEYFYSIKKSLPAPSQCCQDSDPRANKKSKKNVGDDGAGKKWPSMHQKFKEQHGLEDADLCQKQLTWVREQLQTLELSKREFDGAIMTFAALRKQKQQVARLKVSNHCKIQQTTWSTVSNKIPLAFCPGHFVERCPLCLQCRWQYHPNALEDCAPLPAPKKEICIFDCSGSFYKPCKRIPFWAARARACKHTWPSVPSQFFRLPRSAGKRIYQQCNCSGWFGSAGSRSELNVLDVPSKNFISYRWQARIYRISILVAVLLVASVARIKKKPLAGHNCLAFCTAWTIIWIIISFLLPRLVKLFLQPTS